jgi:hypothetical protein
MAVSGTYAGPSKPKDAPIDIMDDLQNRFHAFAVPSEVFDPSSASPALLRKYGLPPRPDPDRQPFLRQTWNRGFGAPLTLQKFRFNRDLVQGDHISFAAKAVRLSARRRDKL